MKITRFESFLERSVPYFIIGLLLVILLVMGSCTHRSELKTENGIVMAKQYEPDTRGVATGVGMSTGGNMVITTHNIGHDEMYILVFKCDHGVVFSVNDRECWAELSEGDTVEIDYFERLNRNNEVVDLEFGDATKKP